MKTLFTTLMLLCFSAVSAPSTQTALFPGHKTPLPAFTPVAAKCDLSSCQTQCYVNESTCQNSGNSGCSSQAQMCVQSCSSQCQ